jgi:predicted aldo/keto reductase-like oxidoreductase
MATRDESGSRRDFLKLAAAAGAGSLLSPLAGQAQAQTKQEQEAPAAMPLRPLGKTGVKVPILSLGTMFDTGTNQIVLRQAMKLGVTYWDTAESYEGGRSELGIGQYFKKNPQDRAKVFLVSKSYSPERGTAILDQHLKESLERLNTSYIDMYYVHGINDMKEVDTKETRACAEKAKAQGKIKLFGFSTHRNMEELLDAAAKLDWIDGVLTTYNYRVMHTPRMKEAIAACVDRGIGLTAMKTQGGGPVVLEGEGDAALAERFLKQGYTPEQVRLKAVWTEPAIASVCSQMPNLTLLMANAAAALDKTKLSAADLRALSDFALASKDCYCAGCTGLCEGAFSQGLPVGEVMRAMMYWKSYGDLGRARDLYASLGPADLDAVSRRELALAESRCPQGLAIGKVLAEAQRHLA